MQSVWKIEISKKFIYSPYQLYILNFNLFTEFGKEVGKEQLFFEVKKRKALHISSSNGLKELIFWTCVQLWKVYRLAQKEPIFAITATQHPLPQILAQLNFDPRSSPLQNIKFVANRSLFSKSDQFSSRSSKINNFNFHGKNVITKRCFFSLIFGAYYNQ